jgi:hypothetical protein
VSPRAGLDAVEVPRSISKRSTGTRNQYHGPTTQLVRRLRMHETSPQDTVVFPMEMTELFLLSHNYFRAELKPPIIERLF